jgi:hypothetical protein
MPTTTLMSAMVSLVPFSLSQSVLIPPQVGLSRRATTDERSAEGANELAQEKTLTQSDVAEGNGQPFTAEQLSKAMTAATIQQQG